MVKVAPMWSPDPFWCMANGLNKPCASNIISSALTGRFPQKVMSVDFHCCFSASKYCSWSSTDEARINTIKAWPPLRMKVYFIPHLSFQFRTGVAYNKRRRKYKQRQLIVSSVNLVWRITVCIGPRHMVVQVSPFQSRSQKLEEHQREGYRSLDLRAEKKVSFCLISLYETICLGVSIHRGLFMQLLLATCLSLPCGL